MAAANSRSTSGDLCPIVGHVWVCGAARTVLHHPTLAHTSMQGPYKVFKRIQPLLKLPLPCLNTPYMAAASSRSRGDFGPTISMMQSWVCGTVRTVLHHPTRDHTSMLDTNKVFRTPQQPFNVPYHSHINSPYMSAANSRSTSGNVVPTILWGIYGYVEP